MSEPLPLYRPEQVRAMDAHAIGTLGVPGLELMRRAGAAAWGCLRRRWPQARRIGVLCGPGNNGGDGYVLAALARAAGFDVQLRRISGEPARGEDARRVQAEWFDGGGEAPLAGDALPAADVWVDALFGTGFSRAPEGAARAAIAALAACGAPVLALDLPSGLDADRGHAPGPAVRAAATISFVAAKRGLFTGAGREFAGEVEVDALGLPADAFAAFPPAALAHGPASLARALPRRHADSHKGRHGHVLCLGGDTGFGGAVRLCAEAALRVGAGLVSVGARRDAVAALLATRPEAMGQALDDDTPLAPLLARATVLAVGPGLGRGAWGARLAEAAVADGGPLVLDADGLNWLAANPRPLPQAVLTPHPGEAARLLASDSGAVQADRFAAAEALARRFEAVVVLKGAGTLVAAPGRTTAVVAAGNPGLASGGTGDVLTGVIAALRAQGLDAFDAAVAGALLHAAAGDAAARDGGERGLLASDLLTFLRRLANP